MGYNIHEGVPSEQFQMFWKSEMVPILNSLPRPAHARREARETVPGQHSDLMLGLKSKPCRPTVFTTTNTELGILLQWDKAYFERKQTLLTFLLELKAALEGQNYTM